MPTKSAQKIPGSEYLIQLPKKELNGKVKFKGPYCYNKAGLMTATVWEGVSGWWVDSWDFTKPSAYRDYILKIQIAGPFKRKSTAPKMGRG